MDSWRGDNRDPVTLNKYLYANSDPAYFVDPSGNFGIGSFIGYSVAATFISSSVGVNLSTHFAPFSAVGVGNWQPQTDGRITAHEAAYWHRNGNGIEQSVLLDSIDFQGVQSIPDKVGETFTINLINEDRSSNSDALVYGQLDLKLVAPNTVEYVSGGKFNFEHHPGGNTVRNLLTLFGRFSLGKGTVFDINLTGRARIY